jgi:hypothetical protein
MQFLLPIPPPILTYVRRLARLGALDYTRGQDQDGLFLPHAVSEDEAALIRSDRDSYFAKCADKKRQIAEILAPYHPF